MGAQPATEEQPADGKEEAETIVPSEAAGREDPDGDEVEPSQTLLTQPEGIPPPPAPEEGGAAEREEGTIADGGTGDGGEENAAADRRRELAGGEDVSSLAPPKVLTEEGADLPGYAPSAADLKLQAVLGDYPHQNDGTHLDGGVRDDKVWQQRWRLVVAEQMALYRVPSGAVGRRFVQRMAEEWKGVRDRKWNAERPLLFAAVVLQRKLGVRGAKEI